MSTKPLAEMLGDSTSPEYQQIKRAARERMEHAKADHSCPNGCVNYFDPDNGEYVYGYGPAGCSTPICQGQARTDASS